MNTPFPQTPSTTPFTTQRIDKWLWFARFFKTRTLAAKFITAGHVRLTRHDQPTRVEKPATYIRENDTLSFMLGERIKIIRIRNCGKRRGPASEARTLYEDLSPPLTQKSDTHPNRHPLRTPGSGRPTKKERRAIDALKVDI